jgi:hypothetical protein
MTKFLKPFLLLLFISTLAIAQQYRITGKVTSASSGEALVGANVYLQGTNLGAASDDNGEYRIEAEKGMYTLICSYIGYEKEEVEIDLTNNMEVNFNLKEREFSLSVRVIADRAKERETPVAFTNVSEAEMETQLGSRDIPLVLNTTPSVYATQQGGGAGDARINIRGFDQRNVAIMINGVPVNDMENGWVYWSNWDGLGDATSSIQVQRGLSAVNLATPSIGGTMNIITDPSEQDAGFYFKQEIGSGEFDKKTFFAHTGIIDEKFAMSAGGVRKTGVGVIDATWTDAWAYYFGASYNLNKDNRLELYALGAPQRHGQNLYQQNIAAYSHSYAKELGYSQGALDAFSEEGRLYNQNWAPVNPSYNGYQNVEDEKFRRHSPNFINERENFYHKPQVNMNWYSKLSNKLSLYTTVYYSGGEGGGTGTYGDIEWDYSGPSRTPDWNATIAKNTAADTALGILRNSRNNQWTIGAISKAYYKVNNNLKTSFGLDWRTAEIEHYREVRDLLGGDFYIKTADEFNPNQKIGLGDKMAYNFTNTVDWLGAYGQAEYTMGQITAYGMAGVSGIKYTYTNHFRKGPGGGELTAESDNIYGYQIKGGLSYRLTTDLDVYANAGYVSKVPIFDQVINDRNGTTADDPQNEKFMAFEVGSNYTSFNDRLFARANFYYTTWNDRSNSIGVTNPDGTEGLVFLSGMNQRHIGFELEGGIQPIDFFKVEGAVSVGNWVYTDNVSGTYVADYSTGQEQQFNYYVKDLKVGDAPQTQLALAASIFPINRMEAQVVYKHFTNHFAAWDPFSRTNPNDDAQSWETPSYNLVDLHLRYTIPIELGGANLDVFAHVFNVFDEIYIQDATDNSSYNAYRDSNGDIVNPHSASAAEVFLGLPRTFNLGISIYY